MVFERKCKILRRFASFLEEIAISFSAFNAYLCIVFAKHISQEQKKD
jgi:hypothetical protein